MNPLRATNPSDPDHATAVPSTHSATSNSQPFGRRFDGQVALITGASDRGIGGAIAERLAAEGAAVALVSRHEPKRLVKRLTKHDRSFVHTDADITRPDDIRRAIDDCMGEFGKIDVLVNNAGIATAKALEKMVESDWDQLLRVNLHGAIAMSHAALPHLAEPGGVIVNVSSVLGLAGCPGFSIYSASKAGLIGFTQSLAWELAPRGMRVVGVAPGMVHTPMTHQYGGNFSTDVWQQIKASHPLGMGATHDVAAVVAFLASHEARWITGVTLPLGWAPQYPLPTSHFMSQ